jgi:hypothetical protein
MEAAPRFMFAITALFVFSFVAAGPTKGSPRAERELQMTIIGAVIAGRDRAVLEA